MLIAGRFHGYLQPRFMVVRSHFDYAGLVVDLNCAPVRTVLDHFDAWGCSRLHKAYEFSPVKRRAEGKMDCDPASPSRDLDAATLMTKLRWRLGKCRVHRMVELPDAFETGIEGDFSDRKIGLLDQAPREVHTTRTRYSDWRGTYMLDEQAPQVPRTNAH